MNRLALSGYCLLSILLQSCGLFKNSYQAQLTHQQKMENFTAVQDNEQFYNETAKESLYVASDSSAYDYNLEIWPKGRFSYSPEKGYEGEAEKVKISKSGAMETLLKKEQADGTLEMVFKDTGRQENHLLQNNLATEQTTKLLSWKWVIGIGLFLTAVLGLWYLRR